MLPFVRLAGERKSGAICASYFCATPYSGNPVACAAALAVFQVIETEHLLERSDHLGARLRAAIGELKTQPQLGIGEIRGLGGMSAFELIVPGSANQADADAAKGLTSRAAELGLILLSCGVYANTIRVLVPLTVEDAVFEEGLALLAQALREVRG